MNATGLIEVTIRNDVEGVLKLLESGINPNQSDSARWTPLHYAAQNLNIRIAKLLSQHGAGIDNKDSNGNTPLWRATFNTRADGDFIKMMLEYGADPLSENDSRVSPLDLANRIDNYDMKKYFKTKQDRL